MEAADEVVHKTRFIASDLVRIDLPLAHLGVGVRHQHTPIDVNLGDGVKLGGDLVEVLVDHRKHLDDADGGVLVVEALGLVVELEEVAGEADFGSRHYSKNGGV